MTYYTPMQLANDSGLNIRTARRVLRDFYPRHEEGAWWRIDDEEYRYILYWVRHAQQLMPDQPRRMICRKWPTS